MSIVELPARWEPDGERTIAPEDWARYERYLGEIFAAFGMDLGTPGTKETPKRFLRAVFDATTGYDGDAKLRTAFFRVARRARADGRRARHGPTRHVDGAGRVAARGRTLAGGRTAGGGPPTRQLESADVAQSGRADEDVSLNRAGLRLDEDRGWLPHDATEDGRGGGCGVSSLEPPTTSSEWLRSSASGRRSGEEDSSSP